MPRPTRNTVFADKFLRALIAPALFAEIALRARGCWSPDDLERTAEASSALGSKNGEMRFDPAGLFRDLMGSRVPTDDVLSLLCDAFRGARLKTIKHHPFWNLLMVGEAGRAAAATTMNALPAAHRRCFHAAIKEEPGRRNDFQSPHNGLRSLSHADALVSVTAALRCAQENDFRNVEKIAKALRNVFPRVVSRIPQLFIRWRHLAKRYQEIGKVTPFMCDEFEDWGSLEEDVATAAAQARAAGFKLPPDSVVAIPEPWKAIIFSPADAAWQWARAAGLLEPDGSMFAPIDDSPPIDPRVGTRVYVRNVPAPEA